MAQQDTYGNWLGSSPAQRLPRQPGLYSMAGKVSPAADLRPGSPGSFDDDYDDISVSLQEQSHPEPPGKGVYLLAGPPSSSQNLPEVSIPKSQEFPPNRCRNWIWGILGILGFLGILSSLAWGVLLGLARERERAILSELEFLKSNLSGIWDSAQLSQTQLHFVLQQHQQELQEISELLCRSVGNSRNCPSGWKSHGRSCFGISQLALGWSEARNACRELGAELVVIDSEEEQDFLLQNLNLSQSYWIGVSDQQQEGKWVWVSGNPKFRFWDVWSADPAREQKDCGAIGPRGFWVNEFCSRKIPWVCEKPWNC